MEREREKNALFLGPFLPGFRRSACPPHSPRTEDFNLCAKSRSPESHSSPTGGVKERLSSLRAEESFSSLSFSWSDTTFVSPSRDPDSATGTRSFPPPLAILIDIFHGHFHREISVITLHIVARNGFCSWRSGSEGHDDGRHVGFTTTVHGGHTHGAPEARQIRTARPPLAIVLRL